MATFRTDFSEFPLNPPWGLQSNPNWTGRYNAGGLDDKIQNDGDIGGQCLWFDDPMQLMFISYDGLGTNANVDILARIRSLNWNYQRIGRMFARATQTDDISTAQYYYCQLDCRNNRIEIWKHLSDGALSQIATAYFGFVAGFWVWVRFRLSGTSLKAKAWQGGYIDEPVAWHIDIVDGDIGGGGWAGPGGYESCDYDFFSLGTSGDIAPGPIDTYVNKLTRYNYVKPLHVDEELVPYTLEPQIWPMDF